MYIYNLQMCCLLRFPCQSHRLSGTGDGSTDPEAWLPHAAWDATTLQRFAGGAWGLKSLCMSFLKLK